MRRGLRIAAISVSLVALIGAALFFFINRALEADPFTPLYVDNCSVCHGESFGGSAQGPALTGGQLAHGETVADLVRSISAGFPERGMPGWSGSLDTGQIQSLAILIAERRVDRTFTDFKVDKPLAIPTDLIRGEVEDFRIELVATGLDPLPFSIAPLPDGRILLSEKQRGLSFISEDGERSEPIRGAPQTSDTGVNVLGLEFGLGWLLDVAPHPDYLVNGWIYLMHGHLCPDCGDDGKASFVPVTMNRLIRGRIDSGEWMDEQVLWEVDHEFYTSIPDIAAGGRLAFDNSGHVFFSVGIKGMGNYVGIQDLRAPYGKIHRIHDDGRIPEDNPFFSQRGAMPSIWSYGHRSPQGLEFDPQSGQLWGTEMGPRGGDEINLLRPGRNYGWPLYSKGVDYDGTPVEYWKDLGIEFDLADIEQPVVDLTPSPAVSSFVVYAGDAFPQWRGDLIVGSLKATELYRVRIESGQYVHTELLLKDLARIRDIETATDGSLYLLLEHRSGSQIVRLVPG